jgi:hypothetical protein
MTIIIYLIKSSPTTFLLKKDCCVGELLIYKNSPKINKIHISKRKKKIHISYTHKDIHF